MQIATYNTSNIAELKCFIYNSYIHDAQILKNEFTIENDQVIIKAFNEIYNIEYSFVFENIESINVRKGNWGGSKVHINSLTIESSDESTEIISLAFELFSGTEINILAKTIMIDSYSLNE